ncbi:MAG: hypothetical protein E7646_05570 [Ruminococcaceae bacterium]|nr:hypothetical protein [Oscillospiraceae bacterium]
MDSKLEELLEARNIENENELKNALDKIISEHKSDEDTALLDEAIELRLSLEGISDSALQEHLKKIRKPLPKKKLAEGGAWLPAVKRILPMAAAFAIIVSVMLLIPHIGDGAPVVPTTDPFSSEGSSSIISSAPATTSTPPATTATPPTSTVPPTSTGAVAPPATGGNMGTSEFWYSRGLSPDINPGGIIGKLKEYQEAYDEWAQQFEHVNPKGTRDSIEHNAYTAIVELGIPREKIEKLDQRRKEILGEPLFFEGAIDMIYSGDKAGFYSHYLINAFLAGEEVITGEWLVEHSVEEYKEAGITYELLNEHIETTVYFETSDQRESVRAKLEKLK